MKGEDMPLAPRLTYLVLGFAAVLGCATASAQTATDAATADFNARCSAAGVVDCQGFDDASVFTQAGGLNPRYGTTTYGGFQDTSVKMSGNSSLRFDIVDGTGADVAGSFTSNFGQTFSQNSTFYVQFAARFDSNFINTNWNAIAQTTPKLVDFYDGADTPCANIELTTVEWYTPALPTMYSECGGRGLTASTTNITSWQPTSQVPYLLQQGTSTTDGYNCPYGQYTTGTGNGTGCFFYPANTWVTFYYKVSVGTWGQPNSSVQAWVIINGVKKQWIDVQNYKLSSNGSSSGGFNKLMFTPYMTNKSSSVVYPTGHMWIDELIVSSQPIAAPQSQPLPEPPGQVQVN